jgi:hypothetical protein
VNDPGCLVNLIDGPTLAHQIDEFRMELLKIMERTNDQETPNYRADYFKVPSRRIRPGNDVLGRD